MLIVGLGNPEKKYEATFHNVGFCVVDALAEKMGVKINKIDCRALVAVKSIKNEQIILAKPQTYMNLSGESVKSLQSKYNLPSEDILVVYDDLDLSVGAIRMRKSGSSGTHNGMRSIVSALKTENFTRLRVGIGRPPENMPIADYVLSNVPKQHFEVMRNALDNASNAILELINGVTFENAMSKYNSK